MQSQVTQHTAQLESNHPAYNTVQQDLRQSIDSSARVKITLARACNSSARLAD